MTRGRKSTLTFTLLGALLISASAHAGVQEFTDKDEWIDAVGEFTTIGFTGFEIGTFITDQYADLGILFTDGSDSVQFSPTGFPNDEWGLDGNGDIAVAFDTPQLWIGADFPGILRIELYRDGRLFYVSKDYGVGIGQFVGLLSTKPFDAALLIDAAGEAEIDDLHFGVPAPGTLPLLALGALWTRRRRRGLRRGAADVRPSSDADRGTGLTQPGSPTPVGRSDCLRW